MMTTDQRAEAERRIAEIGETLRGPSSNWLSQWMREDLREERSDLRATLKAQEVANK